LLHGTSFLVARLSARRHRAGAPAAYPCGRTFQSLKGRGFKSNFYDIETNEDYWISGPRKDGADRLYGERDPVEIDADVEREYWRDIRGVKETPAR